MKTERSLAFALVPGVLSLLLALGVMTLFSACGMKDDGTWMHCHDAQNAVAMCAGAMTVVLAIAALVKKPALQAVLYVAGIVGSLVAFLLPGSLMPMCMMSTMRCYTVMQPFVRVMSVAIAVVCAICAVRAGRASKSRA